MYKFNTLLAKYVFTLPQSSRDALQRAFDFAADAHAGQTRKGKSKRPYVEHCEDVVLKLINAGVDDPVILMAAALHDTLEDTEATYDGLALHFGEAVANLVAEVSDDKASSTAMRKFKQVTTAKGKSFGACLIKVADKTANIRDMCWDPPENWKWMQRMAYVLWAEKVAFNLSQAHVGGTTYRDSDRMHNLMVNLRVQVDQFWHLAPEDA